MSHDELILRLAMWTFEDLHCQGMRQFDRYLKPPAAETGRSVRGDAKRTAFRFKSGP
jgi:hypothetical protein